MLSTASLGLTSSPCVRAQDLLAGYDLRRDTDENLHDAFTHSITVKTRKRMCRAPPPGKMHRRGVEHADDALVAGSES